MKKILALVTVLLLVLSLAACDLGNRYHYADSKDINTQSLPNMTMGQKNALDSAKSYVRHSDFSYGGLIDQLEYEGYTTAEATFAADNCGADWNEEALQKAKSYLKHSAFSRSGLIDQLEYGKFTAEQATYAVNNCGADWKEQAAKCAESYLKHFSYLLKILQSY